VFNHVIWKRQSRKGGAGSLSDSPTAALVLVPLLLSLGLDKEIGKDTDRKGTDKKELEKSSEKRQS